MRGGVQRGAGVFAAVFCRRSGAAPARSRRAKMPVRNGVASAVNAAADAAPYGIPPRQAAGAAAAGGA